MRVRLLALAGTAALLLGACAAPADGPRPVDAIPLAPPPPRIVGADGNGATEGPQSCKISAGYLWCQAVQRCERPWELARDKGFPNTLEGFQAFCQPPAK
ncbi:MAG: hypothetical protein ACLGJD_15730 [Gammaproteobacteria bacterium]|jgi:hypothetical protein|uniref:hypothetical protein n=1 Tax=unclassified Pseudacidovorax TaxID=2620592 RepID=UPI001B438195|nr:hypothetical protein [Pseudacidovorax sp.]MBP6895101.1 hypothetical protein [Pseudacidovorax sp.]